MTEEDRLAGFNLAGDRALTGQRRDSDISMLILPELLFPAVTPPR